MILWTLNKQNPWTLSGGWPWAQQAWACFQMTPSLSLVLCPLFSFAQEMTWIQSASFLPVAFERYKRNSNSATQGLRGVHGVGEGGPRSWRANHSTFQSEGVSLIFWDHLGGQNLTLWGWWKRETHTRLHTWLHAHLFTHIHMHTSPTCQALT